jgi:hypothetical protein
MMDIQNFLNFTDENVDIVEEGKEEDTLVIVIAYYTDIIISAEEDDVEENINIPILSSPTYDQTLQALQILLAYKESRQDIRTEEIRVLERIERDLQTAKISSLI